MFTLQSEDLPNASRIDARYTGEGTDISPVLSWSGVPQGTKEFALIVDDPDAPTAEPWVHWVIYGIPANATALPEAVPTKAVLSDPVGAKQGKNSWNTLGYRGPLPPPGHGTHHYYFTLYALDAQLNLKEGLTKKDLLLAIQAHVLAKAQLLGTYSR